MCVFNNPQLMSLKDTTNPVSHSGVRTIFDTEARKSLIRLTEMADV